MKGEHMPWYDWPILNVYFKSCNLQIQVTFGFLFYSTQNDIIASFEI